VNDRLQGPHVLISYKVPSGTHGGTRQSVGPSQCDRSLQQYFGFPCQYHSTIAPYSFIHLPPTLYNVFLPVLQFPLSVSFHHCSILIFIYRLLQPEGQTGAAWEHSERKSLSGIGERWIEDYFHIFFRLSEWGGGVFFVIRARSICPRCTAAYRLIVRPLSPHDF
jgi:hypothetical protein